MNRFALLWLLIGSSVARADTPPPSPPAAEPWQIGVTDDQKAQAQTKLDEGNAAFVDNRYDAALVAYQAGLTAWDHPSIRFNVAATLIALDRPVEAQQELERAMKYGPKPLRDQWREALTYRALLARSLATITIQCTQPEVEITLDTETLPRCPTTQVRRVRAGEHVLLGQRATFLTKQEKLTLAGGEARTIDLTLTSLAEATVTRTRWAIWKPWVVTAAGAGVAAMGLGLELSARSQRDDYRRALTAECSDTGCPDGKVSSATADLDATATLRHRVGIGTMVVGGLGLAAGVTLLVMNRAYSEVPRDRAIVIVPLVPASVDGGGLALVGSL